MQNVWKQVFFLIAELKQILLEPTLESLQITPVDTELKGGPYLGVPVRKYFQKGDGRWCEKTAVLRANFPISSITF